jgi:hypothetical protein
VFYLPNCGLSTKYPANKFEGISAKAARAIPIKWLAYVVSGCFMLISLRIVGKVYIIADLTKVDENHKSESCIVKFLTYSSEKSVEKMELNQLELLFLYFNCLSF